MMPDPSAPRIESSLVPVLLLAVAVVGSLVATTVQLVHEHQALTATADLQARGTRQGDEVRDQVEALLSGATRLAVDGNPAARSAIESLAKQGIAYTPPR